VTDAERARLDWEHHRETCFTCLRRTAAQDWWEIDTFTFCSVGLALRDAMVRAEAVQTHVPAWRRS
jgi:hypothetical protein